MGFLVGVIVKTLCSQFSLSCKFFLETVGRVVLPSCKSVRHVDKYVRIALLSAKRLS